jgi:hypothetical protein
MNDEQHDGDHCGKSDDDHIVTVRIEFYIEKSEDGERINMKGAAINSHIHGVPPQVAAQTLLVIVERTVVGWLAHDVFDGLPSSELAHAMAVASAPVYIKQMIDDLPEALEALEIDVPNDISELMED